VAYDFLYERGFTLAGMEHFPNRTFAALFRRGEVRIRIETEAYDPATIELKPEKEAHYIRLHVLLSRFGLPARWTVDSLEDLEANIDALLAHLTYAFLIDRGFRLARNDHRGNGEFTLVFQRGPLRLRMEVGPDEQVSIEFNDTELEAWTPLRHLLRHIGGTPEPERDRFEDLRQHIDRILAFYDGQRG